MTDRELIEGLIRHDRTAFRFLVDTFQQQVVNTAYHITGNLEDAEDLSQEIFVDVIRNIHTFRQTSTLATWITRITVNRSINFVKRRNRKSIYNRVINLFGREECEYADPVQLARQDSDSIMQQEHRVILYKAVDRLPENQRKAFLLHHFDERSYKEIAEILQTGLPAVESLIFRAKQNLQRSLSGYFTEYRRRKV
jgi:RNA polymerase sigma-70 factor (ECF subfamily)